MHKPYKEGKYFSSDGFHKSPGDGASFEALDSTLSALKRESENDHRFLHDEMEYLKSVKRINMKSVNKYQIFAKNKDYLLNILI